MSEESEGTKLQTDLETCMLRTVSTLIARGVNTEVVHVGNANVKHHSSIYDKKDDHFLAASNENKAVCYLEVVVEIDGIKCRTLLDTGADSSYASSASIDELKIKPVKTETAYRDDDRFCH